MNTPKELLYTKDHEWVKAEDGKAYIGITDFAQKAMGDIVYVELPDTDSEFEEGEAFSVVESVKAASDVYLPVSGKILEANEAIVDDPALLNQDAYGNWMVYVELSNEAQLDELMSAEQYEEFCSKEA